jgi:hypothetical protein
MVSRKIDPSSSQAYLNYPGDPLLAIRLGPVAQRISPQCSCPQQYAEAIDIVSQIPQPNLDRHPHQPNPSYKQGSRSLRLHPKDMLYSTPNPGTRPISPDLSIRQFPMPASLALKMLPILPPLQLRQLLLRPIGRVRPYIPTAIVLIQKALKNLTVMDRS